MDRRPEYQNKLTRRDVLVAGGATVAAVGLGGALAVNAFADDASGTVSASASPSAAEACYVLTSETTEGPYYLGAEQVRADITEDKEGIPLSLRLRVIDADTCEPVVNAAVDIWHCTAMGVYSGYEAVGSDGPSGGGHVEPTDDERYLRGAWKTDQSGYVTFKSILPGWYEGRAVHIHVKVHVDGAWTDTGYEGGHVCHTGQLFFEEAAILLAAQVAPYSTNTTPRTTLDTDRFYADNGYEGGLLFLDYDEDEITTGVHAGLTMGVILEETPASAPVPSQSTASPSTPAPTS
ncbi:dioxygenase [Streptomyces sp. NPDC005808]|uniref:dioxygenase family protein n=1 Tax=Streptomyces sp. NPDC005808 TaxID=3364734 RepID=UPI003681456A